MGVECRRGYAAGFPADRRVGRTQRVLFGRGYSSKNPYYLDETMLERFAILLDHCDEYGIRVVVGLITEWMGGRLYIPSVLYGKNVLAELIAKKKAGIAKLKKAKQKG